MNYSMIVLIALSGKLGIESNSVNRFVKCVLERYGDKK